MSQYESPWAHIDFAWTDAFNIVWGLSEGFLMGVKSNKNQFLCGNNFYNFRKRLIDLYYRGIETGNA